MSTRLTPKNPPLELWPEFRPIEFLLEQKVAMGELSFIQEYLCRVVDDEAAVFPRQQTRKILIWILLLSLARNTIVDTQ